MRIVNFLVALVLGVVSTARAQESCIEQITFPAVGKWAEYRAVFNQKDPYTMRYAVIGSESRGGKELKWLELRMTGGKNDGDMIYQMLVPGSADQLSDVQEVVMKPGKQPAMRVDGMMLNMVRGQLQKQSFLADMCKDVTLVGSEKVTVPAGNFSTRHFHSARYSSDSWVAGEIPFAMVKSSGKDHEIVLVRHGEGAKSSISEEPRSMGGPAPK